MVKLRTFLTIAATAGNATLSFEWHKLSSETLAELVFNIVSRESLILGGVVLTACLTIAFAWPWIRWAWTYPARWRARRRAQEKAEVLQVASLIEELCTRIERRNGRDRELMIPYDKQRDPYRSLRSLINWLGTSGGNYADAEAMPRVLCLFGKLDALRLIPGGVPPENENDGLDLDWHTELGRIRSYLLKKGAKATRTKIRDWYGHLKPAPRDGSAPAVFNYGDSLEDAIAGRGRAEHTQLPETPDPPVEYQRR